MKRPVFLKNVCDGQKLTSFVKKSYNICQYVSMYLPTYAGAVTLNWTLTYIIYMLGTCIHINIYIYIYRYTDINVYVHIWMYVYLFVSLSSYLSISLPI